MRRICSLAISRQSHHPGATSQPICPIFLQRIAHWRGEDAAWLAATTDANVKTLFGIAF